MVKGVVDTGSGVSAGNDNSMEVLGLLVDVAGLFVPVVADEMGLLIDIGPHLKYGP